MAANLAPQKFAQASTYIIDGKNYEYSSRVSFSGMKFFQIYKKVLWLFQKFLRITER
jgi:hypothetical protein